MNRKHWPIITALIVVVLCLYGSHLFAEHQAYKTGVYMGRLIFDAAERVNRSCLSIPADSRHNCAMKDLNDQSVMENALASAQIIPALAASKALRTGFRDGWREARTGAEQPQLR